MDKEPDFLKHALLGAVGGLVGWAVHEVYWKVAESLPGPDARGGSEPTLKEGDVNEQLRRARQEETEETVFITEGSPSKQKPKEQKPSRRYDVHWSYGVMLGAAYGLLQEHPRVDMDLTGGLLLGTVSWLVLDEGVLRLVGSRQADPDSATLHHLHRLGAHLVFGTATAAGTQDLMRRTQHLSLDDVDPREVELSKMKVARTSVQMAWRIAKFAGKTYLKWKAIEPAIKTVIQDKDRR